MSKIDKLERSIEQYDDMLDRAALIIHDAPYFTSVWNEEFAKLAIDGDKATLFWPEIQSGYYDSASVETQKKSFPAELLLMSIEEIRKWKVEQRKLYDAKQKAEAELAAKKAEERQRIVELRTLAALQQKYGSAQ